MSQVNWLPLIAAIALGGLSAFNWTRYRRDQSDRRETLAERADYQALGAGILLLSVIGDVLHLSAGLIVATIATVALLGLWSTRQS